MRNGMIVSETLFMEEENVELVEGIPLEGPLLRNDCNKAVAWSWPLASC
jgi:hypothetical protein